MVFESKRLLLLRSSQELKLPVQYLADNPSTTAEITALLISGPTSYRLRYDFLGTGSQCATYTRNVDTVHQQTNVAADASTSTKVFMKFLSSQDALDYELDMIESLSAAVRADRNVMQLSRN